MSGVAEQGRGGWGKSHQIHILLLLSYQPCSDCIVNDVRKQLALFERLQLAQQGKATKGVKEPAAGAGAAPKASAAKLGKAEAKTAAAVPNTSTNPATTAAPGKTPQVSAAAAAKAAAASADMFSMLDERLKRTKKAVAPLTRGLNNAPRGRISVRDVITHMEGLPRFASSVPLYKAALLNLDPSYNAKQADLQADAAAAAAASEGGMDVEEDY